MMVESDVPLRRSRSFIWGCKTHPSPMAGQQRLRGRSIPCWTLSSSVRSSCRIEGCAELGTHSPQGLTHVFSVLAPLGSIQAEKRSGFFLFCFVFWFLFALCAWQVHKSSYLRLPSNLGRQVIITPILWMSR